MLYVSCTFRLKGVQVVMSIGDYRSVARSRIRETAQRSIADRSKEMGVNFGLLVDFHFLLSS